MSVRHGRGRVFCQLYYHLIWATKGREPLLDAYLLRLACEAIARKAGDLGCHVHAVNGFEDHVHVVLEISPNHAVSGIVGQLKGFSSHELHAACDQPFRWQEGYGALTFRGSDLAKVVAYVANQQVHHSTGRTSPKLERTEPPDAPDQPADDSPD